MSGEKLQGGGYPLTRDAIGNIISRLRKRSGAARLPPRRLRHTFAVNFLDDDHGEGDPDVLRRIMGHERFEVTRQYLVGRQKRSIKEAFDRRSHVDNLGLEERRFRKRPRQEPPE